MEGGLEIGRAGQLRVRRLRDEGPGRRVGRAGRFRHASRGGRRQARRLSHDGRQQDLEGAARRGLPQKDAYDVTSNWFFFFFFCSAWLSTYCCNHSRAAKRPPRFARAYARSMRAHAE